MTPPLDTDDDPESLRARLAEATETLKAIRQGDVDALVVHNDDGDRVYTLHTSDEPYRDLVEQMQEGAVVLTVAGDILYCNARFASLIGKPLETVVGTRFDRFVHASDRSAFQVLLRARGGRYRCQLIGPDAAAFEASVSLTATVINDADRLNLIVTDLRELHEAYSTRDRAELSSRMKDELLAMLAHELRNPLSAINSAALVLASTKGHGEIETRAHDVITRQVDHLSHLIDGLLDVERVASGQIQLNRHPLDMAETVRRVVGVVVGDVGLDRDIEVTTDLVWVNGDAVRLEQVLTNLLTNAIDNTPTGARIDVTLRGEGRDAVLTIADTGVGIAPELLPFIFDTFVQGDRSLDRVKGGLGIGLTLVRHLVELHGGTIVAASDGDGRGSSFVARLRRIPALAPPPVIASPSGPVAPRRVLLIEDNRDAREMFRLMLELAGHTVYAAADGARGLELLKAEHPDVVIVDIGLPGMDGYQVARSIRQHLDGRAMLLLALTGYGRPADYLNSAEAGFDHHLLKPIDPEMLTRLLSEDARRVRPLPPPATAVAGGVPH